jgi:hypothetical protein
VEEGGCEGGWRRGGVRGGGGGGCEGGWRRGGVRGVEEGG